MESVSRGASLCVGAPTEHEALQAAEPAEEPAESRSGKSFSGRPVPRRAVSNVADVVSASEQESDNEREPSLQGAKSGELSLPGVIDDAPALSRAVDDEPRLQMSDQVLVRELQKEFDAFRAHMKEELQRLQDRIAVLEEEKKETSKKQSCVADADDDGTVVEDVTRNGTAAGASPDDDGKAAEVDTEEVSPRDPWATTDDPAQAVDAIHWPSGRLAKSATPQSPACSTTTSVDRGRLSNSPKRIGLGSPGTPGSNGSGSLQQRTCATCRYPLSSAETSVSSDGRCHHHQCLVCRFCAIPLQDGQYVKVLGSYVCSACNATTRSASGKQLDPARRAHYM